MKRLLISIAALLFSTPVLAHHLMKGMPMETFSHGFLSGIGHPILGFDHLFFVASVGIAAAFTGRALTAPLGYVVGVIGGCVLIMGGVPLPGVEVIVALSLIVAGAVLASGRSLGVVSVVVLFGLLGLFHGWTFGMTITGQEGGMGTEVVAGYLIGLAVIQWAVAVAAGWAVKRIANSAEDVPPRLAGAAVAGVGAFLILERIESVALAALGA